MTQSNYTVCLYNKGLERALNQFVALFWPDSSAGKAGFGSAPDGVGGCTQRDVRKPPTFLFLKDDEVIGHITTLPIRVSCRSRLSDAYWVVGFMVLPEYRNGLIGPYLIKKVKQTLDLAMTLHVEDNVRKIFHGLGWQCLGAIPQYSIILNGYQLVSNIRIEKIGFVQKYCALTSRPLQFILSRSLTRALMASLSWVIFTGWFLVTTRGRNSQTCNRVIEENEFDASYDVLWNQVGHRFEALVVRDRAYLESRFGAPVSPYRILAYRKEGELQGYCILKIKDFQNDSRMGNLRVGTIVDCLYDPSHPQIFQALLTASIERLKSERADAILCTASHTQIQQLLKRSGFFKLPATLNFAYHDRLGVVPRDLPLNSWHLMRGDSDADGNF